MLMPSIVPWITVAATIVIALVVASLTTYAVNRARLPDDRRESVGLGATVYLLMWAALAIVLGGSDWFRATSPRPFAALGIALLVTLTAGSWFIYRFSAIASAISKLPLEWLVAVQLYRVLGSIFLVLHARDLLPPEFAVPAGLGDLAIGLTAPLVAFLAWRSHPAARSAVLVWNTLGILALIVVFGAGFLTSPGPFQMLAHDDPNTLITAYPLVLILLFAAPLSILVHLATFRRLEAWGPARRAVRRHGHFWTGRMVPQG